MTAQPPILRRAAPIAIGVLALAAWEALVRLNGIPPYILPAPSLILQTLVKDSAVLLPSLWVTLTITASALLAASIAGIGLAILFSRSRLIEASLYPYAVILQVTPIVAIAPLILIYVNDTTAALLICASIVAFFPILANATLGLRSAERGLREMMDLYRATPGQRLRYLEIPAALPYLLGGIRIAGGLSLIGAVVAEFAAGAGGTGSGLAYRILEAGYRLNIPRLFAALALISITGILIHLALGWLSARLLRRWHDSALDEHR